MSSHEMQPHNRRSQPLNVFRVAGDVLAFVLPCIMFVEVNLIGRLFAPEIVLLCILPILLYFRAKWLVNPLVIKVLIFALLWLSSQIVTDLVREIPLQDWSRGWSKIVFFILNFITLYLLLSRRQVRIIFFCAGIAVGQVLTFYLSPSTHALEYPWKFGLGYPITVLFVLLSQTAVFRRISYGTEILIGVIALVNLLLGFRSLALICVATMAYMFVNRRSLVLHNATILSKWVFIKLILLIIVVAVMSAGLYEYAAENNWLSEKETRKYFQQSSGKYGVLLSGRTEFIASSAAILDSPIIGHGSWAKDPKYTFLVAYLLSELEYENPHTYIREDDLIPSHSYLFGAWVESGIVGAFFWGWVWFFVLKTLCTFIHVRDSLLPLVVFISFNMLWNILFSPFGAEGRLYVAFNLVLVIFVLTRATPIAQLGKSGKVRLT